MQFIKFKNDEGRTICINLKKIIYIEEFIDGCIIWLSDMDILNTSMSLNEILRLIKEAENAK